MDRILTTLKEMWSRYMEEVGPYVQLAYVTDDLGFAEFIINLTKDVPRDAQAENERVARSHQESRGRDNSCFTQTAPCCHWLVTFLEMNVDILNPVQTSVSGPRRHSTGLKESRLVIDLSFHGAIDVQQMLPNATHRANWNRTSRDVSTTWAADGGLHSRPLSQHRSRHSHPRTLSHYLKKHVNIGRDPAAHCGAASRHTRFLFRHEQNRIQVATHMQNPVKQKLKNGHKDHWWLPADTQSPVAAEIMSQSGFDWLMVDLEHAPG